MKVFRPLQLGYNNRVLEQNRAFHFIASATLGIDLRTGSSLLEFDYLKDAFACMGDKPLPDMGMPKPRGEFLVSGAFHAPGNKQITGGEVKARVGQKEKRLYVFGPRAWHRGVPSKPEPITSMPLDYAHAFGGENNKKNPDGIGHGDGLLPCVENPGNLIASTGDTPDPAGFSPLDPSWPQRMRFQGTYDNSYLKKCFPGYPPDHDWHYFLCAPQDQWLEGYFRGNESFELHNMHPDIPVIRGSLPDLYPRCFVRHTIHGPEPRLVELPLNLDTIWFFPERMLALCIWRGGIDVADDEGEKISQMLLAYEDRAHRPRGKEHYAHALERRMTSDDALLNNFNTEDLIPAGAKCAMELLQEMAFEQTEESPFDKNIEAKAESVNTMADEKVAQAVAQAEQQSAGAGVPDEAKVDIGTMVQEQSKAQTDPAMEAMNQRLEAILPGITGGDPSKIELKSFSFDKIDQIMDTVAEFAEKKEIQAKELVKEQAGKVGEQLRARMADQGIDDAPQASREQLEESLKTLEGIGSEKKPPAPLPRLNAEEIIAAVSGVSPRLMEAMQHIQSMKAMGGDGEEIAAMEKQVMESVETQDDQIEAALRKAEEAFKEVYFMSAHFMDSGLSPHKEPVETITQRFLDAVSAGEDVAGKDWACIDLSGRKLDGVDLGGAYLEQVNLKGASLKGANLSNAMMARAELDDADLSGANLEGANVGGVHASRTSFAGANMKSAKLSKGDFSGADFSRCELADTETLEITINHADFTDAHMPGMKFIECEMRGTTFVRADMETPIFYNCAITSADFTGAKMTGALFTDVRLREVVFDTADLTGACFVATDPLRAAMERVRFAGAFLNRCNFRDMVMPGTELSGASMENANFGGADLSGAQLTEVQANSAQFRKAILVGATLDRASLMEGSLAKANIANASLAGANCYNVDFLRSNINNTGFDGCNLDGTLIETWQPK